MLALTMAALPMAFTAVAFTIERPAPFTRPAWLKASYRKVGGLHFMRLGKLQVSFCITQKD